MLIVSHNRETAHRTWTELFRPYPVRVAEIGDPDSLAWLPEHDLILCDVDLGDLVQAAAARRLVSLCRGRDIEAVFLVGPNVHHDEIQAYAAGATRIVRRDGLGPASLQTMILGLLEKRAAGGRIVNGVVTEVSGLSDALGGLFDAVLSGAAIDHSGLSESSEGILEAARGRGVHSLLEVIWQYDNITYQHCLLVSGLSAAFALKLGFASADRLRLTKAAIIHDVGKAYVPLELLSKPGRLSPDEFAVMQTHTTRGHELLRRQGGFSADELSVVRSHHEYLNGTGYPDALANGQVPDLVRLITITDICAALIERRPYKEPMSMHAAYAVMESMTGKLDSDLLRAFRTVIS